MTGVDIIQKKKIFLFIYFPKLQSDQSKVFNIKLLECIF